MFCLHIEFIVTMLDVLVEESLPCAGCAPGIEHISKHLDFTPRVPAGRYDERISVNHVGAVGKGKGAHGGAAGLFGERGRMEESVKNIRLEGAERCRFVCGCEEQCCTVYSGLGLESVAER